MKIHEITPKDYTDLHRLYCQLEDDWTSDIQDMIRVLEEVKDDPHYRTGAHKKVIRKLRLWHLSDGIGKRERVFGAKSEYPLFFCP